MNCFNLKNLIFAQSAFDLITSDYIALTSRSALEYIIQVFSLLNKGKKVILLHPGSGRRTMEKLSGLDVTVVVSTAEEQCTLQNQGFRTVLCRSNNDPEAVISFDVNETLEWLEHIECPLFFQTSGTTGAGSRFVEIPFQWLLKKSLYLADLFSITHRDTGIVFSSMCFIQVFWTVLMHASKGGRIAVTPFQPKRINELMSGEHITSLVTTASVLRGLLMQESFTEKDHSIVRIIIGGDYMNDATFQSVSKAFPNAVYSNIYGCTELSAVNVMTTPRTLSECNMSNPGIGIPSPFAEIKLQENGNGMKELLCRTSFTQGSYAFSKESFLDADGFFHTGDLVHEDINNCLYYDGRNSGIINCNGQKINSQEIESLLLKQDGVEDCVVLGMPDQLKGELAVCFLVVGTEVNEAWLRSYLTAQVGASSLPQKIVFLPKLPKTASGKTLRDWNAYKEFISE